jgi:hypothetical protein
MDTSAIVQTISGPWQVFLKKALFVIISSTQGDRADLLRK